MAPSSVTIVAVLIATFASLGVGVMAQAPKAKVSGTVFDQVGGLLPYVAVVLTHRASMAHHEARTDQVGQFEIEGVTAGDYLLEAERSGFTKLHASVTLAGGEHLRQELTLHIGTFEEGLTVTGKEPPSLRATSVPDDVATQRVADTEKCEVSAVGGDVRPPMTVRVVRPEYPARLRDVGINGTVVLIGRLTTEGTLKDVRVQTATHHELAAPSVAAVTQWRWVPAQLNCVTIEANMTVTVSFRLQS